MPTMTDAIKERALEELAAMARLAVIGAGVSGQAAARLLRSLGKDVLLIDDRDRSQEDPIRSLISDGVRANWGAMESARAEEMLDGVDALILSPGIGADHPLRCAANRIGINQIPEVELAWMNSGAARTVAISGTNGKTTVTMLIEHIVRSSGLRTVAAGNIGLAFCDAVLEAGADLDQTIFAIEVSSFQLESIRHFCPEIALLLNITSDHLDRHGDMRDYAAAKGRITINQDSNHTLIVNQDDALCLQAALNGSARKMMFSLDRAVDIGAWLDEDRLVIRRGEGRSHRLIELDRLPMLGMHNVANCLAAACAASALGMGRKQIGAALETFCGIPHRLEHIATIGGVEYINDSKATNLDSMIKAIASFQAPIHLIAGGRDKDSPFSSVLPLIESRVVRVYLIGEAADKIEAAWGERMALSPCGNLIKALEQASGRAEPDEIILLSPGCASFDQFKSYADRGRVFRDWTRGRMEKENA